MKKRVIFILLPVLFMLAISLVLYQPSISVEALKLKYGQAPSKYIQLQHMDVHFRDEGNQVDSIPMVLLHGTSSSLLTWEACVQQWKKEHRVIRMDIPAFALTGPHPNHDYSIDMYVSFLHEFLLKQNIQRCYLIGNSLGGLIAWHYAARYPTAVAKLVLIDAAGYPRTNFKGNLAFRLARIPVLKDILTVFTPLGLVRKSVEDVYGDKSKVNDTLVEQYRDLACREGNREALVKRLNYIESYDTTLISAIQIPALVLWGEKDKLILPSDALKFKRDLPHNKTVVLAGLGHVPMEESPETIIPIISGFINDK
jgi:pimeloyl-ACP methyl ester carboxylesterase